MKKNLKTRVLLSVAVASLFAQSAAALDITFGSQNSNGSGTNQEVVVSDYFDITDTEVKLKENLKGQDLTFKFAESSGGLPDFPVDPALEEAYYKTLVKIDLGKNYNLNFANISQGFQGSTQGYGRDVTNLNATAKEITGTDVEFLFFEPSVINANLTLKSTNNEVAPWENKGSMIVIASGQIENIGHFNGSLVLNGNLSADKTFLNVFGSNFVQVNGNANITNSKLAPYKFSYGDLTASNIVFVRANSFNNDVLTSNKAGAMLYIPMRPYISSELQNSFTDPDLKDMGVGLDISETDKNYGKLIDYKLGIIDCGGQKCLVVNGVATANAKSTLTQLKVDIAGINKLISYGIDDDKREEWLKAKAALEAEKARLEALVAEAEKNGGQLDDNKYLEQIAPDLSFEDKQAVLALRKIAPQLGNIGADLASREGVQMALNIKKETQESTKALSNLNSASSAMSTTMNVANDVSIHQRVAMLHNPYGNFAHKLGQLRFAANSNFASDARIGYVSDYNNGVWGNAFGGSNIIDGNKGAMYGLTLGLDRQADNVIYGLYASYANSTLKYSENLEQKNSGYQLGLYSNLSLDSNVELGLKAYAQLSKTTQDSLESTLGSISADYNQCFLGLSANAGYVFELGDTFIKPLIGANYYFNHTPAYTQKSEINREISSRSSHAVSLELGSELRNYMGENSYIFATPKIEQYVMNSSSRYMVNLIGGETFTSVRAEDKKKTYAQLILGGNVNFTERLSANLGLGAKQILAGKADNKNETYLSGQIGLKYRY